MTASAASRRLTLITASLCAMLVLAACRTGMPMAGDITDIEGCTAPPPEVRIIEEPPPAPARIYQPPLPSRPPTA